ncbi:hypothetical protein FOC1_g10008027 [Fusarium oxysporum f. sp. cubense race 1]|uniref:DUF7730 domain-containing protein n=1 Tax=Fusarium oxysporum f. sp. cubense (strain race 1) TaxID=1229664 RepID=N4U1N9_FUSC1|nr:hypothetical protein FOC1_g10008027 [Fusarium oxysporum f. sp. cubense race 1]
MRVSEGSPYPPSESDISEIPRDLEKEDAIKKLSLLPNPPPRPRCLTPSGFRDVVTEQPGLPRPTFQHCAYYKLPPDVRRYILILTLGNRRLHMDFSYDYPDIQRVVDDTKPSSWLWWGSVCHRLPPDLDVSRTGPMTHGGPDGPWADTCRVGDARHCGSWPGSFPAKCRIGTMGWLLSCRQNYAEAIDILYSTNTIIMSNEAMITHLPQLLLPQRLASITSLEISWNLKSRYESGLWIPAATPSLFISRALQAAWAMLGPNAWPAISLHLDNLARVMLSLTEHAISLPDTPFDSILYDAKETGFVLYSEICHSYNQIWRSTDGAMDVIRLPYVDSYPKAPYHIDTSTSRAKATGYSMEATGPKKRNSLSALHRWEKSWALVLMISMTLSLFTLWKIFDGPDCILKCILATVERLLAGNSLQLCAMNTLPSITHISSYQKFKLASRVEHPDVYLLHEIKKISPRPSSNATSLLYTKTYLLLSPMSSIHRSPCLSDTKEDMDKSASMLYAT